MTIWDNPKQWQMRWKTHHMSGFVFHPPSWFPLLRSRAFCHSGVLAAFHCKFKAHSGNHWRRPGNLHSFVRRENKRWRKHGAVEFSKSPWQRELSNDAVNHTWTGRDLSRSTRTHAHTIMENFSMIGYPTFLQERGPRRRKGKVRDGVRKLTMRERVKEETEKRIHRERGIRTQKEKHSCIINTRALPGQTPPSACPKD